VEDDEAANEDEDLTPPLPPEDRLWRHPSEIGEHPLLGRPRPPESRLRTATVLAAAIGALLATGVAAASDHAGRHRRETVAAGAALRRVAQQARRHVVAIHVDGQSASGLLFGDGAHVLTAASALGSARSARVDVPGAGRRTARLAGADPETNLAVLSLPGRPAAADGLAPAPAPRAGQVAVAVGREMAVGVVRSVGRRVALPGGPPLLDMIETDLSLPDTASGQPLVDLAGATVGLTVVVDGRAWAVPVSVARDVGEQLAAGGKVVRSWLGVDGDDLDEATARQLGLPGGAVVKAVHDASPARAAGLSSRDVITAVDGAPVDSMASLTVAVRNRKPGAVVDIEVVHDGERRQTRARLEPRPD
jgi:S1-C subfamily serine protease